MSLNKNLKKLKMKPNLSLRNETLNGLSVRHVAQIVRRRMIQKSKPSAKAYRRIKFGKKDENNSCIFKY